MIPGKTLGYFITTIHPVASSAIWSFGIPSHRERRPLLPTGQLPAQ